LYQRRSLVNTQWAVPSATLNRSLRFPKGGKNMNKPMKTPFYIIVVKTKDDRLYAEVDSTVGKKNAREIARGYLKKLRSEENAPTEGEKSVNLRVVVEEWESEEDYDQSSGGVETVFDKGALVKESVAKRYDC
jgi:hypothetical protein